MCTPSLLLLLATLARASTGPLRTDLAPTVLLPCEHDHTTVTTACMTTQDYDRVADRVVDIHTSINATQGADLAGCLIRFVGHDAMDYDPSPSSMTWGGVDGCVNFNDPDNTGLAECLTGDNGAPSVATLYQSYCDTVSLADFLVIAAEALIAHTSSNATDMRARFRAQFRFGRTTSADCTHNPKLPDPERSCVDVEDNFVRRLGLNWREAATLMGAHTIGRARAENSGYVGWWSDRENSGKFNNNYYTSLLLKGWIPQNNPSGANDQKNQWMRSDLSGRSTRPSRPWDGRNNEHQEMMLNSDMCLLYQPADADFQTPEHSMHLYSNSTGLTGSSCCAWVDADHLLLPDDIVDQGCNDVDECGCDDPTIDPRTHKIRWDLPPPGFDGGEEEEEEEGTGRGLSVDPRDTDPDRMPDCYNFEKPNGPPHNGWGAASAVVDFTRDERMFYKEFVDVWSKVTTNGYDTTMFHEVHDGRPSLRPLQRVGLCAPSHRDKRRNAHVVLTAVFVVLGVLFAGALMVALRNRPSPVPIREYPPAVPESNVERALA